MWSCSKHGTAIVQFSVSILLASWRVSAGWNAVAETGSERSRGIAPEANVTLAHF